MPIQFPVAPGTILLCDYSGFRPPEMIKRRPVVVISPRLPHRDHLCAVVPLSTTAPGRNVPYVCRLELAIGLPPPFDGERLCWAKADMVATVGFGRLDLFRTGRDVTRRRQYLHPRLSAADLQRVRAAVLHGLGLGDLTAHLD